MTHRNQNAEDDEDTETSTENETIDTEESSSSIQRVKFLGVPIYKFSYERLPRKCLKLTFLAMNSVMLLAGITAVVISIWMLADSKLMSRLIGHRIFVTILLLVGAFASAVSFLGILAFVKKKRKFLVVYIVCQTLSLCIIFIAAIMSFIFFDNLTVRIRNDMISTMENYHNLDWATESWDNTQRSLECCGITSYKDWIGHRIKIPQSCCSTTIEKCLKMSANVAYKPGCFRNGILLLKSHVYSVSVSTLIVSIIIVVSLFVAFGIRRKFKMY